jgi:hypothetical protein
LFEGGDDSHSTQGNKSLGLYHLFVSPSI